jgi:hypothetical protein
MTRTSNFDEVSFIVTIEVNNAEYAVPRVINVIKVAPDVARLCYTSIVRLQKAYTQHTVDLDLQHKQNNRVPPKQHNFDSIRLTKLKSIQ